ncbi:hypothetical protein Shyhy01_38440 [Streptomyces hygroscopicus subsp. hygroscopicus]|nr:hypothetical protein Shyhy01_38440 [Streptomyces hygroscopicus subsp. hygroscopicus]
MPAAPASAPRRFRPPCPSGARLLRLRTGGARHGGTRDAPAVGRTGPATGPRAPDVTLPGDGPPVAVL